MKIVIFALGILIILTTLLRRVEQDAWWIRILDFPLVQASMLTTLVLGLYWFYWNPDNGWDNMLMSGLIICLVYQMYLISAYTFLHSPQVKKNRHPDSSRTL
ncbi:MAG: hypothetical protein HC880_01105 [Bacteroidia bacterium]|nr:hypothetical protein [Bacteroidia bacterium]